MRVVRADRQAAGVTRQGFGVGPGQGARGVCDPGSATPAEIPAQQHGLHDDPNSAATCVGLRCPAAS